jgi:uncharacterized damage-inducible protein DinB
MTIFEAMELFGYGSWANARMFASAEALTPRQQEAAVASSFPSISATLAHIVGSEWYWSRVWTGSDTTSASGSAAKPTVAELRAQLAAVEAERAEFLASMTDADLGRVVSYRDSDGGFSIPLGQSIRHMVNHSSYHRGQLATQLRQLGQTPPNTDFTRYLRERR